MKKVFLTGATGFLGTFLLEGLLARKIKVLAASREAQVSDREGLEWVQVDLSDEDSLHSTGVLEQLQGIDTIIHAAALYRLDATHEMLYRNNVIATANLLNLIRTLGTDVHLTITSTIAIAGDSNKVFHEGIFDVGQKFRDAYASTKFAAEQMLRSAKDIRHRSIFRLGIVVGSSKDGYMPKVDGPYYLQKAIRTLLPFKPILERIRFLPLPFDERSRIYIVPVDYAAESIIKVLERRADKEGVQTFHVIGGRRGVSPRHILTNMLGHYGLSVEPVPIYPGLFPKFILKFLSIPDEVRSYMNHGWTFNSDQTEQILKDMRYPAYRAYASLLMNYADKHLFQGEKNP